MTKRINYAIQVLFVAMLSFAVVVVHAPSQPSFVNHQTQPEPKPLSLVEQLYDLKAKLGPDFTFLTKLSKIDKELYCLAQNNFYEARAEPFEGKVAVAEVVINRTKDPRYPGKICDVVRQAKTNKRGVKVCQFSWWCQKGKNDIPLYDRKGTLRTDVLKEWRDSVLAALVIYQRKITESLTNGATHYYAHKIVNPYWAKSSLMVKLEKIGGHTFMFERRRMA